VIDPGHVAAVLRAVEPGTAYGFVRKIDPSHIVATGPIGRVRDLCDIEVDDTLLAAEIVALDEQSVTLMALEHTGSIALGAKVRSRGPDRGMPVGNGFAGRTVDALGRPIDDLGPVRAAHWQPAGGTVPRPLERMASERAFDTGIRAIDALLPLCEGQRVGVFAASGVGKTSLIEQLAMQADCDRCILCLVGERGREVHDFWQRIAAADAPQRFTLVAATSDESAVMRARAVDFACTLAEYWRAQGEHVLLIVDSVTRLAMALREIGLAAGLPPTVRAYTPNIFSALPRLVERCGAIAEGGAVTAVMTVLAETDDVDDPLVELMKSLLDGHIVLSRGLADRGHFPAIDVTRSVSRQSHRLMARDHADAARSALAMLASYDEARIMIESGVYQRGATAALDRAIAGREALMPFLAQPMHQHVARASSIAALVRLIDTVPGHG